MLIAPQNLPENVARVRERIAKAAADAGRAVESVTLLAVGKAQPVEALRAAAELGIRHFGENYLREALTKISALRDLGLTWHFIGRMQANKTRDVAERFAWAHTVDRLRIAQRLSDQRPHDAAPLNICIQVNLAGEVSKGGTSPEELPALAAEVAALPRLKLRGLMCLPPPGETRWFAQLRRLLASLNASGMQLDTLSMGMSADLEAAILQGATIVRIGTAVFGERESAR
jgi:pyridoxal phosphate enzyme (YggS family)